MYSPFQIYICILKRVKVNNKSEIFILTGAKLKVMCILKVKQSNKTKSTA